MSTKTRIAAAAVGLFVSAAASAAIIDNGTYTTDTTLGLNYLDVGLVHGDRAFFDAGVMYDGKMWRLANATELASTWSDVTGLALTSANVLSGDNDMGAGPTASLIRLFDGVTTDVGVTGEAVIGDYDISGYYNYIEEGGLAVHDVYDDSHFGSLDGYHGGWLVSAVPEPSTYALFGLGLLALFATRRKA